MNQSIQFNGDSVESQKISVVNKTGGKLVVGGVYALDLAGSVNDNPRDMTANLVAVTTNNIRGILAVAIQALDENESGLAAVAGPVNVRVSGTVALTDRLKPVAGENHLVAASNGDSAAARPLQANASGVAVRTVFFDGLQFTSGFHVAA